MWCSNRKFLSIVFSTILILGTHNLIAFQRGIYITQSSAENTKKMRYFISRAKQSRINTFVVDINRISSRYARNIALLHQHDISYVARIVIFPGGARTQQIQNKHFWQKKYRLIEQAAKLGAKEIQLDYIRYRVGQPSSAQNAKDIHEIIQWFYHRVKALNLRLQIDIFGVAAHGPSRSIGQNLKVFASAVDTVCPMVYPSHYEPFRQHAKTPYQTIFNSLSKLKKQFNHHIPFQVIPYIELSNYRYPMNYTQRQHYIRAQIHAVKDQDMNGWYAWSAKNQYNALFNLLESDPSL